MTRFWTWLRRLFRPTVRTVLLPGPKEVVYVDKIEYVDRVETIVEVREVQVLRELNKDESVKLHHFNSLLAGCQLSLDMVAGKVSQDLVVNRLEYLVKSVKEDLK